jgi:hypothetical protein
MTQTKLNTSWLYDDLTLSPKNVSESSFFIGRIDERDDDEEECECGVYGGHRAELIAMCKRIGVTATARKTGCQIRCCTRG